MVFETFSLSFYWKRIGVIRSRIKIQEIEFHKLKKKMQLMILSRCPADTVT